jgi:hypothetical protein
LRRSAHRFSEIALPDALTPGAIAVCVWVVAASRKPWTGIVPAAVAALFLVLDYGLWRRRRARWRRLALEVGPGLALTGLVCTLVSYYGRHRP